MSNQTQGHDKWLYRSNNRHKQEFGVHQQATLAKQGHSTLHHYAVNRLPMALVMVKENIEVLRLMKSSEYKVHREKLRETMFTYYKSIRDKRVKP